ncbi:MAG TPA: bifunctional cobalt-precorrin-7 (C(5))-methyltransferase/cobalt-precorrin-6B (C(15))-methyltransferase [Desulfobacteraceae bacterium]|nr:bifunctional cobalt-precorrin-7 (C(5))-methyltransferase/cobalt-precorrin-6B (C(15))-methyltransferase [Desulfobacteraceae bacterium]|tara:strand:+ start:209 stop:1444 length:1236 start_codon:yes stop_codon:yes gene_type:complete
MSVVHVIGIGQSRTDLTEHHLSLIYDCDLLVGGERQLNMFPDFTGNTLAIKGKLDPILDQISSDMRSNKIVVLASGDPLFYGIGTTLSKRISATDLKIHPNVTSVGAAFAAICQPWHDAKIISLHGHTEPLFSFQSLIDESKVAFLTGPDKDPAFIAHQLIQCELDGFKVCVLEHLGDSDKERITWFTDYKKVAQTDFSHPNIVILLKSNPHPPLVPHETFMGMPDTYFRHSRGLITKSEVRSISLSRLRLSRRDHVLWDIGSGSGSVGIEASLQIPWGSVFAVEKNQERIPTIIHNIKNFNRSNIKVSHLNFPTGHDTLKTPDRVFIGGGGKDLSQIIACCCDRLVEEGIIVVNTVILESMHTAMSVLSERGFTPDVVQVQVSRGSQMPYGTRMNALNPVWIVSGTKPNL